MSSAQGSREAALGGPTSAVETACPLDCPDACSLAVTVQRGKVIEIDGSHKNPVTDGFICAKVRKFGERVYGRTGSCIPAIRKGRKGEGKFKRVSWDEALELIVDRIQAREGRRRRRRRSCRISYGGSNGLLTQDNFDATLWRRFGTSRLARTVCAAPTGAANMALYGKMPSVTYQDYPEAALIILWGVNPSASGIHLVPVRARGAEARREARRHRSADDAARAIGRRAPAGQAGHRRRRRAGDSPISVRERLRRRGVSARAHARRRTAARARRAVDDRQRGARGRRRCRARSSGWRSCTRHSSPALIRCGWGLERNRNGGNAAMAVLALPGRRRQVRRARRRLLDEQLGVVEHRSDRGSTRRSPTRASST